MGIQLRLEVGRDEELKSFEFGGLVYVILGESTKRDMISDAPYHVHKQYFAMASNRKLYEVYVYYYTKFENDRRFAVVNAIRPAKVAIWE